MKKYSFLTIFTILSFFLSLEGSAQYKLEFVNSNIRKTQFISSTEGFGMGINKIYHTTDQGYSWNLMCSNFLSSVNSDALYDAFFLNANVGWIITGQSFSDSTFVCKTVNGGVTWTRKLTSEISSVLYGSHRFQHVDFVDANIGWVTGKGIIKHTIDGGNTWTTQFLWYEGCNNIDYLTTSFFWDDQNGWVAGTGGLILHTNNAGNTWTLQHEDTASSGGIIVNSAFYYIGRIHFSDSLNGTAPTNDGNFLKTVDGGNTWTEGNSSFVHYNVASEMLSDQNIWMVGGHHCDGGGCYSGQSILYSTNGGNSWESLLDTTFNVWMGQDSEFSDVHFLNDGLGYTSTWDYRLYRIVDTTAALGVNNRTHMSGDVLVYPNPSQGFIDLDFEASEFSNKAISLEIIDMLGQVVLGMEYANTPIDLSCLKNGVYTLFIYNEKRVLKSQKLIIGKE